MQNNIINVNSCLNCPFRYSDYDSDCFGYDTLEICNYSKFLKLNNYIIDKYNSIQKGKLKLKTPNWCPVLNNNTLIKFENMDLVSWYKKGFEDELKGMSSILPDNDHIKNAYFLGVIDCTNDVELYKTITEEYILNKLNYSN